MNLNPFRRKAESKSELSLDRLVEKLALIRNTVSGVRVSPETAMAAPTVFAVVNRCSRAISMSPYCVHRDLSTPGRRKTEPLKDHSVTRLLSRQPNPLQTAAEYWALATLRLLLYGWHVARKQRDRDGNLRRLVPIHPDSVGEPRLTVRGGAVYPVIDPVTRLPQDVNQTDLHIIRLLPTDLTKSTSPVRECAETIAMEIAAERFGATVFGSGAIPNGIIKRKGHFNEDDAKTKFLDSWKQAFGMKSGGGRGTAILEDDFEFQAIQMSPEESQFLETRRHQRSVIAGAFGIPPHLVGDLERATFSNIEQLSIEFVTHAVKPILNSIVQAVDRDCLSESERDAGLGGRFDISELLKGDAKSTAEANQIRRQNGVINANEWREEDGLDAREDDGGDDYIRPLNFTVSGDEDGDSEETGTPTDGAGLFHLRRVQ